VLALPLLLLVTAGAEPAPMPPITIDPCVDVDLEEVRRLTAIELSTSVGDRATRLDVEVACTDAAQELTVRDRASGRLATRSIDLDARLETDRDAKARELALAIAELVRRAVLDSEPEANARARPTPPPLVPSQPHDEEREPRSDGERRPWRGELGLMGTGARWSGGEVLFGVDVAGRIRVGRWLIADVRLGGRKTRPVELRSGTIDAAGMAGAMGLSVDVIPFVSGVGVALGLRVGGDWLRYSAVDAAGATYGGRDAGSLSASGTATAFVTVSSPLCLTADASAGTALHSIAVRDNGQAVSGVRGLLVAGALGLSAQF
jgi:hypothetical protein